MKLCSTPCLSSTLYAGSMLEGGGQILRNAAALAAITATPIKVTNIRAGRSKPGLRAQHLAGLQLVAEVCKGNLQGGKIGSQEISLRPQHISSGYHIGDTKTAGSCMLLAQVSDQLRHHHCTLSAEVSLYSHTHILGSVAKCMECCFSTVTIPSRR